MAHNNIIVPITYQGQQFAWYENKGTAFASDLRCPPGKIPGQQVYRDAADHGFIVIGKVKRILFTLVEEILCGSGMYREVGGWKYSSSCGKFNITIFND